MTTQIADITNQEQTTTFTQHAVAVDVVLFSVLNDTLQVLLIHRNHEPYAGKLSLPGGVVGTNEAVDAAAVRALQEETGIADVYLEQLYTFGEPTRDPRQRVITVTYYALVDAARQTSHQGAWHSVDELDDLAFDHQHIVAYAHERLRNKLNYTTIGFQLLPERFTLTELQNVYEVILGQQLDKRNFRRKMLQLDILEETDEFKINGRQRPARLHTFRQAKVTKLQERGLVVTF